FSVLGNHLHLVVEADHNEALSRGMQGLAVRVAKAMNRLMGTRGRVLADHYDARTLDTPTQLVNAIAYVVRNATRHYGTTGADPFSSTACERAVLLCAGASWLIRAGWRRGRGRCPRCPRACSARTLSTR